MTFLGDRKICATCYRSTTSSRFIKTLVSSGKVHKLKYWANKMKILPALNDSKRCLSLRGQGGHVQTFHHSPATTGTTRQCSKRLDGLREFLWQKTPSGLRLSSAVDITSAQLLLQPSACSPSGILRDLVHNTSHMVPRWIDHCSFQGATQFVHVQMLGSVGRHAPPVRLPRAFSAKDWRWFG